MIIKWRWIPGYKRYYRVSDTGLVKSVKRYVHGPNEDMHPVYDKILKPNISKGYEHVVLSKHHITKTFSVHRLVLLAFVGPRPEGMQCRHLDGNKRNNRLCNLKWGTPKENQQDRVAHQTDCRGERQGSSKLTTEQVLYIREQYKRNKHGVRNSMAKKFNVTHSNVCSIIHRRTWKHI
jgi:hypothetical protein